MKFDCAHLIIFFVQDGKAALHFAYLHSHMEITDFLLKNNVDINAKDKVIK
jgi:hypothetical protein